MVCDAPENLQPYMPLGCQIMLTVGHFEVRSISTWNSSYGSIVTRKCIFQDEDIQPGRGTAAQAASWEFENGSPYEQIHGHGILVALRRDPMCIHLIGFWNPKIHEPYGSWLAHPANYPELNQLKATSATVEKKGLFGTRKVPFVHDLQSLDRLHEDIMDAFSKKGFFQVTYQDYLLSKYGGSVNQNPTM